MFEKTENELYAEKWLTNNGYDFKLIKQYISKSKYQVAKNNVTETFELPADVTDIAKYMDMFEKSFAMKVQILNMEAKLNK